MAPLSLRVTKQLLNKPQGWKIYCHRHAHLSGERKEAVFNQQKPRLTYSMVQCSFGSTTCNTPSRIVFKGCHCHLSVKGFGPGPSSVPARQSTACRKEEVLDSSTVSFGVRSRLGICRDRRIIERINWQHGEQLLYLYVTVAP